MCGIAGAYWPRTSYSAVALTAALRPMLAALKHRGPDGDGIAVDPDAKLIVAHRRLAITDLSPDGAQPMWSPSRRWLVTFNGEIYNYRELSGRLPSTGHSAGDTAVLAAALDGWGWDRTLEALDGMFAIAAWDARDQALHLVRDRFGEKPLAYAEWDGGVVFASEVRALAEWPGFPREIDTSARSAFVERGYLGAPRTVFRAARKLPPGHALVFHANLRNPIPRRYWSLKVPPPFPGAWGDAVAELDYRLLRAVDSRCSGVVPVGVFLSGGLDTAAIASCARDLPAFTIGVDDAVLGELAAARETARQLGLVHHTETFGEAAALAIVPSLARIHDEPFADSSQIPTVAACRLAAQSVKVVLCGDGGDELFGGYPRYRQLALAAKLPSWVREGAAAALRHTGHREKAEMLARTAHSRDLAALYAGVMGSESSVPAPGLEADPVGWMGFQDLNDYFPNDLLVKVDRAAMSCGLETRLPLLDLRLVEFALSLPGEWKTDKRILAHAVERRLPGFRRGPKKGFQVPIGRWLTGPLRDWAEALVRRTDDEDLPGLWRAHLARPQARCVRLWSHLMWEDWIRQLSADRAPAPLRSAPTALPV